MVRVFGGCLVVLFCVTSACGDHASSAGGAAPKHAGAAGTTAPSAAALSACFAPSGDIDTCDKYCAQQGQGCVTTCSTGTATGASQQVASLTWDGPACSCGNPRCPAPDRATGAGTVCNVPGFVTDGNAFPRTSVQCCCQAGVSNAKPPSCDELTLGVWIKQPVPDPMCATDGTAGYEELNFEPSQPNASAQAVQWACFGGTLAARSGGAYELYQDGCSGTVWGFYFMVVGDTLTVHYGSSGPRSYKHAPDAPKRPGNPAIGP